MFSRLKRKAVRLYKTRIKKQSAEEIRIEEYRQYGIKIGKNCTFCSILPMWRDSFLLEFGDNVLVSGDVKFLLHDAAPTVVSPPGGGTDILGKISIGNHCFIGANSIIMPGVTLADYTVVGAGSVVTHSTKTPGCVIAGNPARLICTVEEYLAKNKQYIVNLDGLDCKGMKALLDSHPEKLIMRKLLI